MTDHELIEVLQQKPPSELSRAEVEALRSRWTQSPELRQALQDYLRLESQLSGALGTVQLDVDQLLHRADMLQQRRPFWMSRWTLLIGFCLLLTAAVGSWVLVLDRQPPAGLVDDRPPPLGPVAETELQDPSREQVTSVSPELKATPPDSVEEPSGPDPVKAPPAISEVAAHREDGTAPWSASLAQDVIPWKIDRQHFESPFASVGHSEISEVEAQQWLARVDGQPYRWTTDLLGNPARRIVKFQGVAKLRSPWPDDGLLRITPFDITSLDLYFWRGSSGVALRFFTGRDPHLWVAYEITREGSSPLPTRFGLLTTDSGSYVRSNSGGIDIRHQSEELVLTRGGVRLLSVPLEGPPLEVVIDGEFRLRQLSMHRTESFAPAAENPHPAILSGSASELPWADSATTLPNWSRHTDGSVSLSADSQDQETLLPLPFGWNQVLGGTPFRGLYEVIVQMDSADPGTGIYLGDRSGWPMQRLGFFREEATGQTTFGILRPGEQRTESPIAANQIAVPYVAQAPWFKLIAGLGVFHVLASGDGKHWGHVVESPGRDLPGGVESFGLYSLPGTSSRSIRIKRVEIRELTGITQLADHTLWSRIDPWRTEDGEDAVTWMHRVLERQPAGVETAAWVTTNAVATLSQGPPAGLGLQLLRRLVAVGLHSRLSPAAKRLLVDDAISLMDLYDDARLKDVAGWYEDLGWELVRTGDPEPLSTIRPDWMHAPIWTDRKVNSQWGRLQSFEILQGVYRQDWKFAWQAAQSALFWNTAAHPDQRPVDGAEVVDHHARWARSLAAEGMPDLDDGSAAVLPLAQRHPLVPVLSKEAYNIRAELQSALSSQAYEDACRVVMSISEQDGPGLLPDLEDRQLFVSMSTAIQRARKAHPGFARTMSEKFEPMGQIRIAAALNRNDSAALRLATLQLMGTDAARTAQLSLGDRALAAGDFESAGQNFQDALVGATDRWKKQIEPRLLLARILGGRTDPVSESLDGDDDPIEFNGTRLSGKEFQTLIDELRSRPAPAGTLAEATRESTASVAKSKYQLVPRAQFDGQPGNNSGRHEYRSADAFGRQFAAASDQMQMYVSNRFQINAYSTIDGHQLWAQGLGSEQGDAHSVPFRRMTPLPVEGHVYVRRLTKAGVELACLQSSDGQVVWRNRPSAGVLTDPVVWNGRLFAVTLTRVEDDLLQAEATWFEPGSGEISESRPLFRLREVVDRPLGGELTVRNGLAVCTVAGTTVCFNSRGELKWLRRSILMQQPVDELIYDSRISAPVIESDRVIVTMPGVREVRCLDLESGMTRWSLPIPDLRGVLNHSGTSMILDAMSGIVAVNTVTGEILWQRPIKSLLEATAIDGTMLVISQRVMMSEAQSRPVLVWLDLATGVEIGQSLIEVADRNEFEWGPLWFTGGKWWSLVGQTWKEPKRELHELLAVPGVPPASFIDTTLRDWQPGLAPGQLAEIQSVVPGWFPVADYGADLSFSADELRGESMVLQSRIRSQSSVRFSSELALEAARKIALHLRVGNLPGQSWILSLRIADETIIERSIQDGGDGIAGWHDVSVDLTRWAGQNISVRLIQSNSNQSAVDAMWKRAELVVE